MDEASIVEPPSEDVLSDIPNGGYGWYVLNYKLCTLLKRICKKSVIITEINTFALPIY